MQIGNRIFYDSKDGEILYQTGDSAGGGVIPHKKITSVDYVDLEYGAIDLSKFRIIAIDTVSKNPILEDVPQLLTEEQQRILELENELLITSGVI